MREKKSFIHTNKKYLALMYDKCESLDDEFTDEEIGRIIRASIRYELWGEQPEEMERALSVQFRGISKDIDVMTDKANVYSEAQRQKALAKYAKRDKSAGMTDAEMDAEIDAMFPRRKA